MSDARKTNVLQSFVTLTRRFRARKTYRGSAATLFLHEKEHVVAFTVIKNCDAGTSNLSQQLIDDAQQCRRLQRFLEEKQPIAKESWIRETYACKALTNVRALYFYIPKQVLRCIVEGRRASRRRSKRNRKPMFCVE